MNGNYGWGLPVQASTFAPEIDFGIHLIHWAMLAVFVSWGAFFVYLLIRYRRREGRRAERGGHEALWKSLLPDAFILAFEIGLIVFYAVPSWSKIKMSLPRAPDTHRVAIVAEQYAWNIHYPGADGKFGRSNPKFVDSANPIGLDPGDSAGQDDLLSVNELHIPLGRPTVAELSSKDVVHSFFVPEFRIKQDATPGLSQSVWFEPTLRGTFEIACAQLCGVAHSLMRGDVIVHDREDYEAWLKGRKPLFSTQ